MSTGCIRLTPNTDCRAIGTSCSDVVSLLVQRAGNGRATSTARQRASKPDPIELLYPGMRAAEEARVGPRRGQRRERFFRRRQEHHSRVPFN